MKQSNLLSMYQWHKKCVPASLRTSGGLGYCPTVAVLTTRRSEVQIFPPPPIKTKPSGAFFMIFLICEEEFTKN